MGCSWIGNPRGWRPCICFLRCWGAIAQVNLVRDHDFPRFLRPIKESDIVVIGAAGLVAGRQLDRLRKHLQVPNAPKPVDPVESVGSSRTGFVVSLTIFHVSWAAAFFAHLLLTNHNEEEWHQGRDACADDTDADFETAPQDGR